jgi:7-keto-8-aminopelargonate synthetase-like enzyme
MRPEDYFADDRRRRAAGGLQRTLRPVDGPQDAHVVVDGRRVLSLSSNNYLGLANHPAVIEAAVAAARQFGVGAGASRLISGNGLRRSKTHRPACCSPPAIRPTSA